MIVRRTSLNFVFIAALSAAYCTLPGAALAQTKPAPKTAKPAPKSAPPAKKPVAPAPVVAAPAPPPPPSDVRFKSKYTNGDEVTESASFISGARERYEMGDTVLLKQHDLKRLVQISRGAAAYLVVPESAAGPAAVAPPAPPGVINVTVSITDTGERKQIFGVDARRVKTEIHRLPQPGACDTSKISVETDAWYIDMPKVLTSAPNEPPSRGRAGCTDELKTTQTGDGRLLGFPISYRSTYTDLADKEPKPSVVSMEVSEFEVAKLDGNLFDIPPGFKELSDSRQLAKAISDANEAALAKPGASTFPAKQSGALRVGVPEVVNKTKETVDTRAVRSKLITELQEQKIDVVAMAAADTATLEARARELGVDYLLLTEITELKSARPGGLTRLAKTAARESTDKDVTEAKLNIQLVAPGAKPRLAKNTSGKDGGIGLKTGLGLAKFAGTLYLRFFTGGMFTSLNVLGNLQMMNLGGMTNPALFEMQSGMAGTGSGVDRTAGAAMFIMQTAMSAAADGGSSSGPSYDAALSNAVEDAGKEVVDTLKKPVKK